MGLKRLNKYRNKKSKCILNHLHDSILEANVCNRLYTLARNKEIKGYKIQKRFPFTVNNTFICTYVVDFWVLNINNTIEVWEAKGIPTADWVIKKKLFSAIYPEIPLKVITKDTFK